MAAKSKKKILSEDDRLRSYELYSTVDYLDEAKIQSVIGSYPMIKKYAYVLHDKDRRKEGAPVDANDEFDEDGLCTPHYHILLWFKDGVYVRTIAGLFGIKSNYVSVIDSEVGALAYLTHSNSPNKYQYSVNSVVANFDIEKEIRDQNKAIEKREQKKSQDARLQEIFDQIRAGVIRPYNLEQYITDWEYSHWRSKIEAILDRYDIQAAKRVLDTPKKTIFITGAAGSGKSTYAAKLAESLGYDVFVSSDRNDPFFGYNGEPCVILDDLRPGVFAYDSLLKMTDPVRYPSVKSRYKNKVLTADLIIITSIDPLTAFYPFRVDADGNYYENYPGAAKDAGGFGNAVVESSFQLERRMYARIDIKGDRTDTYFFNSAAGVWTAPVNDNNPISSMYAGKTYYEQSFSVDSSGAYLPCYSAYESARFEPVVDDIAMRLGGMQQLKISPKKI